jgi:DNA-binding IclR family transcriptional regulator
MKNRGKMSKSILSLVKAGKILELFIKEDRSLGITEFSRALDMPKATVQNLASTLEEMGYLEKDPMTLKYRLGAVLFQLGMQYANSMDLTMISRVWLEKLCNQYGEVSQAGIVMGERVVIVMKAEPDSNYMVFPQAGSVVPAHTSAISKILLAYMGPIKRDMILDSCSFARFTDKTITTRESLMAELDRVRREGIAFDSEESISGLSCIAGPVFNSKNECMASVSLSGNAYKIESRREEIINAVKYVCYRVSEQLGYKNKGI